MTETSSSLERSLQQMFKYLNRFMLLMWRLGLGAWINIWPEVFGRILVITHTGRKTGLPRKTPVNYAIVNGDIYVVAGFGHTSDWYRNLLAHPEVEVWLPDGWWSGLAEEVSDKEVRLPLIRHVLIASGFAARVAGINPHTISDQDLDRATQTYRLMRIRRTAARTGPGGQGDLAWVWPLATMFLIPILLKRRSRRV